MSYVFTVSDDEYARIEAQAQAQGATADALFHGWVNTITASNSSDSSPDPDIESELAAAKRRWLASGSQTIPSDDDLRVHPILRLMGILETNQPGWADQHDEVFGGSEDLAHDTDQ